MVKRKLHEPFELMIRNHRKHPGSHNLVGYLATIEWTEDPVVWVEISSVTPSGNTDFTELTRRSIRRGFEIALRSESFGAHVTVDQLAIHPIDYSPDAYTEWTAHTVREFLKEYDDAMSNEQYALLEQSNFPTAQTWQAAIDDCGFDFQLDPDFDPRTHAGFLPCKLLGKDAGVEISYDDAPDLLAEFADFAPDRNCCLIFRWGGSIPECASAMIASYALAKSFNAIVSFEGEPPETVADLLRETNDVIEEAKKDL